MADITLHDGKEITFDLSQMTYGQYKALFDPTMDEGKSDETIARVAGISVEEFNGLPYEEYKRLMFAFWKRCREPMSDPNSASAPT